MSRRRSATAQAIREIEPSPENQEELLGLIRLIEYSQGFTLAFARCNQVPLRQEMAGRLADALASIGIKTAEVELAGPVENLRESIVAHMLPHPSEGRLAVMVYGFEHSIPSGEALPSAVGQMNMARDLYRRDMPYPLVLWLPEYAISAVARAAPDFWHWRSGVFQFTTPPGDMEQLTARTLHDGDTANLTLERKKERIYILERLLEDYHEVRGQDLWKQRRQAELLHSLADVHYELGHYGKARRLYQESLGIRKELGDKAGMAATLHNLGLIAEDQGHYDEAYRLYRESLGIRKELGDKAGMAATLHTLGLIALDQGRYDEARRLLLESQGIYRELGDKAGMAVETQNLGALAYDQGNYQEAHRCFLESLEIKKKIGYRKGEAISLHSLGEVAHGVGNFLAAERLYQQSLDIWQELGNRDSIAYALHSLGRLADDRGDLQEARRLYVESVDLYREMGILGGREGSKAAASLKKIEELLAEKSRIEGAKRRA